jgi:hypothetical protein
MSNIPIITVSSHRPEQSYYCYDAFFASCRRYGHEPVVMGQGKPFGGLGTKPRLLLEYLKANPVGPRMIFTDCWDVVFMCNPIIIDGMAKLFYDDAVVFNAERNLFPDIGVENFPETGTPYRFLNSGFFVGPTDAIVAMLEAMDAQSIPDDYQKTDEIWFHFNDQEMFLREFIKQPVPMRLDSKAHLCQTCFAESLENFDVLETVIINKITKTLPLAAHGNGPGKETEIFKKFLEYAAR